jgi:hypothetical protein
LSQLEEQSTRLSVGILRGGGKAERDADVLTVTSSYLAPRRWHIKAGTAARNHRAGDDPRRGL